MVARDKDYRIDVEHFCSQAYPVMKQIMSDNFKTHECTREEILIVLNCNRKNVIITAKMYDQIISVILLKLKNVKNFLK